MLPSIRAFARCLLLLTLLNSVGNAAAASIEVMPASGNGPTLVTFVGDIVPEDIDQFRIKTSALSKAVVAFKSDGGSLKAGVDIGSMIRMKNFWTLVPSGVRCASACAIAWLGGTQRFMGEGAQVGFHAAYRMQDGAALETGVGNAILGAYLNKLGLSDSAIVYITKASPESMTWLDVNEATQLGMEVSLLANDKKQVVVANRQPVPSNSRATDSGSLIGVVLRGRCHMEICSWFSIEDKSFVSSSRGGDLYKVTFKGWSSNHPGGTYDVKTRRTGGKAYESYFFCSKRRPASAFESEGKWYAHLLAPSEPSGISGYNESDYIKYFAVCHDTKINNVYEDGIRSGVGFGYRVNPSVAEQIEINGPADLLR